MGVSNYSMYDVSNYLSGTYSTTNAMKAENSTSRENNIDLDMTDFLQLMIVQLQSQTLDDTMDTSDMLNQLVQMQMVTALTNMTETNIMTYASSLVGKDVTIGIVNGMDLEEKVVTVTGTGMSNGQQVIFGQDKETGKIETYNLNQIMAVGTLPPKEDEEASATNPGATTPGTTAPGVTTPGTTAPGTTTDKAEDNTQAPSGTDNSVENPGQTSGGTDYDGGQGAPTEEG